MERKPAVVWGTSVQTPPARVLLLALWGTSRSRSALRSSPCVRSTLSSPSTHASGWHPLRRGGSVAPNLAPLVDSFGCYPHAYVRRVFSGSAGSLEPPEPWTFQLRSSPPQSVETDAFSDHLARYRNSSIPVLTDRTERSGNLKLFEKNACEIFHKLSG